MQNLSAKYYKMLNRPALDTCACGAEFPIHRNLFYHVRSCESMVCCGRRFRNTPTLRTHFIEAHNESLPEDEKKIAHPECKFCGKSDFRSVLGRDKHVRHCYKNNHNTAQCPALDKTTSSLTNVYPGLKPTREIPTKIILLTLTQSYPSPINTQHVSNLNFLFPLTSQNGKP